MVEIGGPDLDLLNADQLVVNADTDTLRDQVGRLIGIDENAGDPSLDGMTAGLEANLGHAAFLCLQSQGEIANREFLFHRQGEDGIAPSIRETLPYFLGAVPVDQAVRRQQLLAARRDLKRAESELGRATRAEEDVDVGLLAMLREAVATGLTDDGVLMTRSEMRDVLQQAVGRTTAAPEQSDDVVAAQRVFLVRERDDLRGALRGAGEQAGLLRALGTDENGYVSAVGQQLSRLSSIDLLGENSGDPSVCPACGTRLGEEDATLDEMRGVAAELAIQLASVEEIRPRRREAAEQLAADTERLREQLRATDDAIIALDATGRNVAEHRSAIELQAFTRGRIQQFLDTHQDAAPEQIARLRRVVEVRGRAVRSLEAALDPDAMREELASRLTVVGADMTAMAQRLELEHSGAVWLDVKRLTVMVDSPEGAVPLFRVGSAANWIGAHLVAHLALHRYFVRHHRPVPRFLLLDQPTQAYYPSDVEQEEGVPDSQDDREAVRRMFALMRDFCQELSPDFQIIVCDHANLPDPWFQAAISQNWRGGEKLVPASWL